MIDLGEAARIRNKKNHPLHLRLMVDHVVPFAALGPELLRDPTLHSPTRLGEFLARHFMRALITKQSDDGQRLAEGHLGSRMPEGWQFWRDDPFERYEVAGIAGKRRGA